MKSNINLIGSSGFDAIVRLSTSIASHINFQYLKRSYRTSVIAFIVEELICDVKIHGVCCEIRKTEERSEFLSQTATVKKVTIAAVPL